MNELELFYYDPKTDCVAITNDNGEMARSIMKQLGFVFIGDL